MSSPLPSYSAILVSALVPIIAGSHSSLKMPKEKRKELQGDSYVESEEDDEEVERVTAADAYLFPVVGGLVLTGLFFAFKYLSKAWINFILGIYFALAGVGALAKVGVALLRSSVSEEKWASLPQWKLTLTRSDEVQSFISFNFVHSLVLLFSVALSAAHHYYPTWPVANIVALSFAFGAISLLRLDSFFTGAALLGGLFFYDIWFVFGTARVFGGESVMVSVAKNFEGPIKIQFPKDIFASTPAFTMLGLGDIVLPGVMLALALRFDYHQALQRRSPPPTPRQRFPKPYFYSCLASYIAGLATTIVVMHKFKAAQPALLYLSPACIGSVVLCALTKGELKAFWEFDDGAEESRLKQVAIEEAQKTAESVGATIENLSNKVKEEIGGSNGVSSATTATLAPEAASGGRVLRSRTSRQNLNS